MCLAFFCNLFCPNSSGYRNIDSTPVKTDATKKRTDANADSFLPKSTSPIYNRLNCYGAALSVIPEEPNCNDC